MMVIPEFAADLAEALVIADPGLAREVAQRGRDTLASAAQTLDSHWRQTCLERSPSQLRLSALMPRMAAD